MLEIIIGNELGPPDVTRMQWFGSPLETAAQMQSICCIL